MELLSDCGIIIHDFFRKQDQGKRAVLQLTERSACIGEDPCSIRTVPHCAKKPF